MGVGTSQALEDLRPSLFPTQLQRKILTALFPDSAGSLHGVRTHPIQVEHLTSLSSLLPQHWEPRSLGQGTVSSCEGSQSAAISPSTSPWSHDNCRTTVRCPEARGRLHAWPLEFKQTEVDSPLSCSLDLSLSGTCPFQRTPHTHPVETAGSLVRTCISQYW